MPESPVGRSQNAHPFRCCCCCWLLKAEAISSEERLAAKRFGSRKKQLGVFRDSFFTKSVFNACLARAIQCYTLW